MLPTPNALGLGSKFTTWQPRQDEVAKAIMEDDGNGTLVAQCPTAFGKSLAYVAGALLKKGRTCILTGTKGLQDQLNKDFGSGGKVVDVRGRAAFECRVIKRSCAIGPCRTGYRCKYAEGQNVVRGKRKMWKEFGCPYRQQLYDASMARVVVTSYAMWLAHWKKKTLGEFDYLICDEAHELMDHVDSAATVYAHDKWCGVPPTSGGQRALVDWLDDAYDTVALRLEKGIMTDGDRIAMTELKYGLEAIAGAASHSELIIERKKKGTLLRAKDTQWLADAALWQTTSGRFLTSAIVTDKVLEIAGPPKPWNVIRTEPRIEQWRRQIIHIPTVRLNFKTDTLELNKWHARIDQIAGPRVDLGRNGIIHTQSYSRAKHIISRSRLKDLMLTHDDSAGLMLAMEEFKHYADKPEARILVSPSVSTGLDFPHDQCRWQIIAKLPYPSSQDLLLKARAKDDDAYMSYLTSLKLVQAAGRGPRGLGDWCETFIIDDSITWFIRRYARFLPNYFIDAIKTLRTVPKPLDPQQEGERHAA